MKRLTLDETWKQCLKMWRWIVREVGKREITSPLSAGEITDLKREWIAANGFKRMLNDCFFCAYDSRYAVECSHCPAGSMEGGDAFWCEYNPEFNWASEPAAFLRKLESLNRKRKRTEKRISGVGRTV